MHGDNVALDYEGRSAFDSYAFAPFPQFPVRGPQSSRTPQTCSGRSLGAAGCVLMSASTAVVSVGFKPASFSGRGTFPMGAVLVAASSHCRAASGEGAHTSFCA